MWLALGCLVWICVAAANAGGDQWDNPRYRALFLPWMAFLAAWGYDWARRKRDPWLWRLGALVGIFVFLFLEWYISRYSPVFPHFSLAVMIGLTAALCILFTAACLVWDRLKRKKHD
jgi:peptidoglycan/LPS O-acetylase OafA/YrhL